MSAGLPIAVRSFSELRALADREPRGWFVRDHRLIPRAGLVLIVGDPYAGKSSLCACIATAMVAGYGFGRGRVDGNRTFWASGEHTMTSVTAKFERACAAAGLATSALDGSVVFPAERWSLDSEDVERARLAVEAAASDFVVLDSLRRFSDADENSSQQVAFALSQARRLTLGVDGAAKRSVVAIHHLGRNGLPRGSTDLKAVVDTVLFVERNATGWRLRAEHHDAPTYVCDAHVRETDEVLEVTDLVPVLGATSDVDVDQAIKVALATHGVLGAGELREKARLSGANTGNKHIDERVHLLVC